MWVLLNFLVFLGCGLWSLSWLGVVYFLCMWTVVCGYEFKPDLSFFRILLRFGQAFFKGRWHWSCGGAISWSRWWRIWFHRWWCMGLVAWVARIGLVCLWVLDWFDLGGCDHESAWLGFYLWIWFVVVGFVMMVMRRWLWSWQVDLWVVVGFFLGAIWVLTMGCVVNRGFCGLWTCSVVVWWLCVLPFEFWCSRWWFEREEEVWNRVKERWERRNSQRISGKLPLLTLFRD